MQKCKIKHQQKRLSINLESASHLHLAVYENDKNSTEDILKCNFSKFILDVTDNKGRTPLYIAALYRRHELAQLLINAGCDAKVPQENGNTVLHEAVEANCTEMIKLLLNYDKDLLNMRNCKGETALFKAVYLDYIEVAKILIKYGALLNTVDNKGTTPFISALTEGSERCIRYLIQCGCDVNQKDQDGHSALYILLNSKYIKKFDFILADLHESGYNFQQDSSWLIDSKDIFFKNEELYLKTISAAGLACLPMPTALKANKRCRKLRETTLTSEQN